MMCGATLAGVLTICGCAASPDRADTSTRESTAPTEAPSSLVVPPVAQPLDVRAFVSDPCALLDDSQRRELGLPAASNGDDSGDSTCDLHVDPERKDPSNYLRLVVFADGGLADQYAQCGTLDCSRWTTDGVGGYPVIRATDEMLSKYGSCKILLGVADDAVVAFIDVRTDRAADGPDCERADQAATMALATLR